MNFQWEKTIQNSISFAHEDQKFPNHLTKTNIVHLYSSSAFQWYKEHNKMHHCLGNRNTKRKTNKQPSSIYGYECDAIGNILGPWELYGNITKPYKLVLAPPTRNRLCHQIRHPFCNVICFDCNENCSCKKTKKVQGGEALRVSSIHPANIHSVCINQSITVIHLSI